MPHVDDSSRLLVAFETVVSEQWALIFRAIRDDPEVVSLERAAIWARRTLLEEARAGRFAEDAPLQNDTVMSRLQGDLEFVVASVFMSILVHTRDIAVVTVAREAQQAVRDVALLGRHWPGWLEEGA